MQIFSIENVNVWGLKSVNNSTEENATLRNSYLVGLERARQNIGYSLENVR
jgi:hypothetical protein